MKHSSSEVETQVVSAGVTLLGAAIGAKLSNELIEDRGFVGFLAGAAGAVLGAVAAKHFGAGFIENQKDQ